jgi:hypothetical protein
MNPAPAPADSRGGCGSDPRVKNGTRALTRRVRYPQPWVKLPSLLMTSSIATDDESPKSLNTNSQNVTADTNSLPDVAATPSAPAANLRPSLCRSCLFARVRDANNSHNLTPRQHLLFTRGLSAKETGQADKPFQLR